MFFGKIMYTSNSKMGTFANSEDPYMIMSQSAVFHKGLHCLIRQNRSSEKGTHIYLNKSLIIQWVFPSLFCQTRGKNSSVHKGLKYPSELYFTGVVLALTVLCLVGKSTQSYQSVLGIPNLSLSLSLSHTHTNETCCD